MEPRFQWANEIEVERRGNHFAVLGRRSQAGPKQSGDRDLIAEYLKAVASSDEQKAPHYLFASARSTENLLAFVKRFGPICGDPGSLVLRPSLDKNGVYQDEVELTQDLETLRKEQLIFSSMFSLYSEVHSRDPRPESIFDSARRVQAGAVDWVRQFEEQEANARRVDDNFGMPARRRWQDMPWRWNRERQTQLQMWVEGIRDLSRGDSSAPEAAAFAIVQRLGIKDPSMTFRVPEPRVNDKTLRRCVSAGHMVLCEVLNAFPLNLTRFDDATRELPGEDLLLGIRHVLYFMLRADYLKKSLVAQCAWKDCRIWFRVGPQESPCCCAEHALKFRQWKYYHESKGKRTSVARYCKAKKETKTTSERKERKKP